MIRKARKEDSKEILPMIFEILEDMELPILSEEPKENVLNALQIGIETEDYRYSYNNTYVYELEGEVVGVIVGYKGELEDSNDLMWEEIANKGGIKSKTRLFIDKEAENGHYYIDTVSVNKSYRRKGIGKKLIEHAPVMAKENGMKVLSLNCDKLNEKAQSLYEMYGFKTLCEKILSGHTYNYMIKNVD